MASSKRGLTLLQQRFSGAAFPFSGIKILLAEANGDRSDQFDAHQSDMRVAVLQSVAGIEDKSNESR